MKNKCKFCFLDKTKTYNTIFEETENFIVLPALGSLVDGYILIITKQHYFNMYELNDNIKNEYLNLIQKYRNIFKQIYGKYPIVFEHGSSKNSPTTSSASIIHAHTHIVNHNYLDEKNILNKFYFYKIDFFRYNPNIKNYIFYISPSNKIYLTENFESKSQTMRILIAKDLKIENKFNWRKEPFFENINSTIKKIKDFKKK